MSEPKRIEPGDPCNRSDCPGTYREPVIPAENCSCHISPPCENCVQSPMLCSECEEEPIREDL